MLKQDDRFLHFKQHGGMKTAYNQSSEERVRAIVLRVRETTNAPLLAGGIGACATGAARSMASLPRINNASRRSVGDTSLRRRIAALLQRRIATRTYARGMAPAAGVA